ASEPRIIGVIEGEAEAVKRDVRSDLEKRGVPESQIKEKEKWVDSDVLTLRKMALMGHRGLQNTEISEKLGVSVNLPKFWLSELSRPPSIGFMRKERRDSLSASVPIPRQTSESFAYLLGAFAAVRACGSYSPSFAFSSRDVAMVKHVQKKMGDAFEKKFEYTKTRRGGERYFKIECNTPNLVEHVNEITAGNTRIPWEHLVEKEEKLEFLRGFFDWGSDVSKHPKRVDGRVVWYPKIDAAKNNGESLIKEVAVLMAEFGIYSGLSFTGKEDRITLYSQDALKRFKEEVKFRVAKHLRMFRRLSKTRVEARHYNIDEYTAFLENWDPENPAGPQKTANAIKRETGMEIPVSAIMCWIDGETPPFVKRMFLIEDFQREMPDFDTVGRLYRAGYESEKAREEAFMVRERITASGERSSLLEFASRLPKPEVVSYLKSKGADRNMALRIAARVSITGDTVQEFRGQCRAIERSSHGGDLVDQIRRNYGVPAVKVAKSSGPEAGAGKSRLRMDREVFEFLRSKGFSLKRAHKISLKAAELRVDVVEIGDELQGLREEGFTGDGLMRELASHYIEETQIAAARREARAGSSVAEAKNSVALRTVLGRRQRKKREEELAEREAFEESEAGEEPDEILRGGVRRRS
ncbi:MAG: LAGLIDADG family homing endonuclease, partial [Candidatus Altiarchaeota archaeon]